MKNRKKKQSKRTLSSNRSGEEFWEDLMNKPYNEDKAGQAFVITSFRLKPTLKESKEN